MAPTGDEVYRRTFRLGACLGRGGFGEVYRALMSSPGGLESEVAVKMLHPGLDPVGQSVERLRDEGRLLARLDHPTILRAHDLVVLEGRVSLIAEYIDGQDLGECVFGDDRIGLRALLEVISGVASALDAAWTAPIGENGTPLRLVHRDIKPSNIRLSRHGQVKLLDFGIARTDTFQREARTQTDLMVGSPAYMAPERFLESAVDPASDVFALGCTLYEGIVGERVYESTPVMMMSAMALDDERYAAFVKTRFDKLPKDLPPKVLDLLHRTMAYDPTARPTAARLAAECEELSDEVGGQTLARWARERRWPSAHEVDGELAGRVVTEGTLARPIPTPQAIAAPERPAPRRRAPVAALASAVALGVVVLGVGVAAMVAAVAAYGLPGSGSVGAATVPDPPTVVAEPTLPEPVAAAEPTPEPELAPVVVPAAEPAAEPEQVAVAPAEPAPRPSPIVAPTRPIAVRTAPAPAPEPVPEPVPEPIRVVVATPAPVVAPAPTPTPKAPTGHLASTGDVSARVNRGGATWYLPADVEPGTWEIEYLSNGRDWKSSGTVTVEAGATKDVRCMARFQGCTVR